MRALTAYRLFIVTSIFFFFEDVHAVPDDYEAVYSVKLMQADGTLRAKLENKEQSQD